MALTRAFTPLFGRMGREDNILYSVGYNGFGLVNGFYGGKLLCDLYSGELHEDIQLISSRDGARFSFMTLDSAQVRLHLQVKTGREGAPVTMKRSEERRRTPLRGRLGELPLPFGGMIGVGSSSFQRKLESRSMTRIGNFCFWAVLLTPTPGS
jgi:hypothetical protein